MKRSVIYGIGVLILMGITSVASILVYNSVVGGSGEPSAPISAPTIALTTPTPDAQATRIADLESEVDRLNAENAALSAALTNVPASTAVTEEVPAATSLPPTEIPTEAPTETAGIRAVYRITQDESEVRFILNEVLRGQPTTVVGKTDQVAGDILIDSANPAGSEVGTIRINARTLATDNNFRNDAIRSRILQSAQDQYEFIDFVPTSVSGLPDQIEVGQSVSFQVTGDLKIRDITQSVTFDVTATLTTDTRLEGTGTTTVLRSDYNLTIPNAPGVADVTNEVTLEIDFVALQVEQ
ncbi:MAG: YceI family protein [Anaerolineaceae bacterium]|nr:YceI family protein [Anaerolineaceae bacterium]